ncbi:MAG: hypothetical protein Ct9H300mP11_21210 [Chloroflexota bacterium]|nr:MAG: hypothetical protein Ct9H300mP11_21210 [Chloroflexota bacterium]
MTNQVTRGVDDVNNFWKHIANHPSTYPNLGERKRGMAPGALDSMFKEMSSGS